MRRVVRLGFTLEGGGLVGLRLAWCGVVATRGSLRRAKEPGRGS